MSDSYYIVGSLHMHAEKGNVSFKLQPDHKYLSPNKKYAVFYKKDAAGSVVVPLDDGLVAVEMNVPDDNQTQIQLVLTQVSLKRQTIELVVDKDQKIIGFKFPL